MRQRARWHVICLTEHERGPLPNLGAARRRCKVTFAILYATREGQTRRVAEGLADMLRTRGAAVDVFDVAHLPVSFELSQFGSVVLAASVHAGKHEPEKDQGVS